MDDIEKLIKMLESPKASARYHACESLRVAPSLNDAALAALERVSNDPDPEVRDAAQRALNLHQTARKTDTMPRCVTLSCPSCGEELAITGDIDRFACAHCGVEHAVKRAGGLVSLAPAVAEPQQVRTRVDKKAAELALPELCAELAALEEEKGQLASSVPARFSGSTVIGQFLLAVVVAVATVPAMPSGTNPGVAFIVGAAVFLVLFSIHLYRHRRANLEKARQIQETTAGLDEQIRLKREEIARHRAIAPVRIGAGKPERAAISRLEQEIAALEGKRRTTMRRMNVYWLAAISLGLIAAVSSVVLLLAENEWCLVSPIVGAALCLALFNLGVQRNAPLVRAVDQELDQKQGELEKHKRFYPEGDR
jgi:predicted RNA-binding Zn-ribbon protein involved in translation (DUF1610 family)